MAGRAVSAVDYGQSIELVFPIMYHWPYHRRRHLLSQAPFHRSSSRIITHHKMHDDCIETIETIGVLWFLVVPCEMFAVSLRQNMETLEVEKPSLSPRPSPIEHP